MTYRKGLGLVSVAAALACGCDATVAEPPGRVAAAEPGGKPDAAAVRERFRDARAALETRLLQAPEPTGTPTLPEGAAGGAARLVSFGAPLGQMPAYYVAPEGGGKRPAVVWVAGGFDNSIGPFVFEPADPANDQTAAAFWRSGVVTMYPSRRGGNGNPGDVEFLLGEVDDVLAATEWLARQPEVDPRRIYIGGHSTGGTAALLAAELSDRFAGVISLGPVAEGYFDLAALRRQLPGLPEAELTVRSPVRWMGGLAAPVWVIEGANEGNAGPLRELEAEAKRQGVDGTFVVVPGEDHFSIVGRVCRLFAERIAAADSADGLSVTAEDVLARFGDR